MLWLIRRRQVRSHSTWFDPHKICQNATAHKYALCCSRKDFPYKQFVLRVVRLERLCYSRYVVDKFDHIVCGSILTRFAKMLRHTNYALCSSRKIFLTKQFLYKSCPIGNIIATIVTTYIDKFSSIT